MSSGTFEMDSYMPDLMDDFDFGAFLNLPPDDVDQGGEDGICGFKSESDLIPDVCDDQCTDVPGSSDNSTLPGSSESSEVHQSTNTQTRIKNVYREIGYGVGNLYGDEPDASGYLNSTVLKTAGLETIVTEDYGEACTVAPTQEPSRSFALDLPNDSSSQKDCSCISCLEIGKSGSGQWQHGGYICRFPGCDTIQNSNLFYENEKTHYGQTGKYKCVVETCQVTTKSFSDLRRHDKAKHCTNPNKEQFPRPVLWCKYSGNNGFARKDKLKSHYKNIHEGKPGPVKAGRVIKPATLKPKTSGLEGSAGNKKD